VSFTPDHRDPAFCLFVLQLSLDTCIGETRFAAWERANRDELQERFCSSDEPNSSPAENTYSIWSRLQFMSLRVSA
jgi:hypothetical protein